MNWEMNWEYVKIVLMVVYTLASIFAVLYLFLIAKVLVQWEERELSKLARVQNHPRDLGFPSAWKEGP